MPLGCADSRVTCGGLSLAVQLPIVIQTLIPRTTVNSLLDLNLPRQSKLVVCNYIPLVIDIEDLIYESYVMSRHLQHGERNRKIIHVIKKRPCLHQIFRSYLLE